MKSIAENPSKVKPDADALPPYPRRPGHFLHKYLQLLSESEAAAEIGPAGCWLLTVVVSAEARVGWRPVSYWGGDLAARVGLSESQVRRVRAALVRGGWLAYLPGGRRHPARYWVTVPPADASDRPADRFEPVNEGPPMPEKGGVQRLAHEPREPAKTRTDARLDPRVDAHGCTPYARPSSPEEEEEKTEEKNPPTPRKRGADSDPVVIPVELDTPAFAEAWADWRDERRERGTRAYTPRREADQLAALTGIGPDRAIWCINESIRNGWARLLPGRAPSVVVPPDGCPASAVAASAVAVVPATDTPPAPAARPATITSPAGPDPARGPDRPADANVAARPARAAAAGIGAVPPRPSPPTRPATGPADRQRREAANAAFVRSAQADGLFA